MFNEADIGVLEGEAAVREEAVTRNPLKEYAVQEGSVFEAEEHAAVFT